MFWIGVIVGIFIMVICARPTERYKKRIEWVLQCHSVLETRLGRLMYLYQHMNDLTVPNVIEQLEEATKEFADSVADFSVSMKEIL